MAFDGKVFGEQIVGAVKTFVAQELGPLREEIVSLKQHIATLEENIATLPRPRDGAPGRDADLVEIAQMIDMRAAALETRIADIPDPIAIDGKIARHVERTLSEWQRPVDGKDADPALIKETVSAEVDRQLAMRPLPKDGKDGRDGIDAMDAFQNRDGELVLTFANGNLRNVGRIVGEQGPPGESIKGDRGEPGLQGPSGPPGESIRGDKGDAGEIGPAGRDGVDGRDGERGADADPSVVYDKLSADLEESVAKIRDDAEGFAASAEARLDKKIAASAETLGEHIGDAIKEIKADVVTQIAEVVAALPPAEKGDIGPQGERGEQGLPGVAIQGEKGDPGEQGESGEPGRDADPAVVHKLLSADVDALAIALRTEVDEFKSATLDEIDIKIGKSAVALGERIGTEFIELESKVETRVDKRVTEAVAALPPAERGPPGETGQPGPPGESVKGDPGETGPAGADADMKAVYDRIGESIGEVRLDAFDLIDKRMATVVAELPPPEKGERGEPGAPGRDAEPIPIETVREMVALETKAAVSALAKPLDGHTPTVDELTAIIVPLLQAGLKDAEMRAVSSWLINRDGHLVGIRGNGGLEPMGPVVGRDGVSVDVNEVRAMVQQLFDAIPKPRDGRDGADGKSFDSCEFVYDGERRVAIKSTVGDKEILAELRLPIPIYRGVFRDEQKYEADDMTTYGGSIWHATRDPIGKPRENEDNGWRLAVKSGRDGKPGEPGRKGDPGPPGKPPTR